MLGTTDASTSPKTAPHIRSKTGQKVVEQYKEYLSTFYRELRSQALADQESFSLPIALLNLSSSSRRFCTKILFHSNKVALLASLATLKWGSDVV